MFYISQSQSVVVKGTKIPSILVRHIVNSVVERLCTCHEMYHSPVPEFPRARYIHTSFTPYCTEEGVEHKRNFIGEIQFFCQLYLQIITHHHHHHIVITSVCRTLVPSMLFCLLPQSLVSPWISDPSTLSFLSRRGGGEPWCKLFLGKISNRFRVRSILQLVKSLPFYIPSA